MPVRRLILAPLLLAGAVTMLAAWEPTPASAQAWVGVPQRAPGSGGSAIGRALSPQRDPNAKMLVQANQIEYNYNGEKVRAVGNVQIHFGGATLEADQVTYDQKTKRLQAAGNVRLTEADGSVITTHHLDLDDQFRNGFVDSLQVETADKTRFVASRAEVAARPDGGRLTVFQSGIYTACETCKDDPKRPPKWQVRAARIIHDQEDKTIYYEDGRFELFGFPIAYFPYFWTPDPTVKKHSGFMFPSYLSGTYFGQGARVPYFWNIAPDYDLLLAPAYMSRQGAMMTAEWRQRTINGAYWIRGSGIFQQDRSAFSAPSEIAGDRDFRGAIETKGDFRLAQNWYYGWDATLLTDNRFPAHYKITRNLTEAISQAYVFGTGANGYVDVRAMHIYGLTPFDVQKQLPILHPLLDYKYRFAQPVLGGELSYKVNIASLTRQQADFDPITAAAKTSGVCDDPLLPKTRPECLLRGIPGTYTRASVEAMWRKEMIDPFGQIFTPFLWVRGDVGQASISNDPSVSNFIGTGERGLARVMPAVGLDYRYPLISAHSWGTQILEPRAQVIVRPSETHIGRFPNEDSQGLLFDDANLFSISKFPGYDRVEGGGRANVGLQYTAQFNKGGYFNALFGQSYHLFGANSYNVADMANTGLQSGLENTRSDYVARMTFQPNSTYLFASRFRFDEQTFATRRLELEGRVNFDRWSAGVTYGQYDAQPIAGMLLPREGILPSATVKLTQNWAVSASALYSLDKNKLNTISFGAAYIDECISISASYSENFGYAGDIVPSRVLMLTISLRTLGNTTIAQTVGGPGSGSLGF